MNQKNFFLLCLIVYNYSFLDAISIDANKDDSARNEHISISFKKNKELEESGPRTMKNTVENGKLFSELQKLKRKKITQNYKPLNIRLKRDLKDKGALKSKGRNQNEVIMEKHLCNLKRREIEIIYECKPFLLWNDNLIQDENFLHNDTNLAPFSKNDNQLSNNNYFEFNFRQYDITTVSDAVGRWDIPPNVTILRLQYESIDILKGKPFFSLRNTLTTLRLDSNLISFISKSVFTGMRHVIDNLQQA